MKIVKLEISSSEEQELRALQNNSSGILWECSLAILHCVEWKKITWIAKALNRQILIIRTWLERYRQDVMPPLKNGGITIF